MKRVAYYKGCLASLSAKELDTATQALEHDAFLIDPATRQPVAPQTLSMRIDALAQQVHAALQTNSTSPAGTGTRVSP